MVDSPILNLLRRIEMEQYSFDRLLEGYMKGHVSDAIISQKRDELTELEEKFKTLVLTLEEENRRLKKE